MSALLSSDSLSLLLLVFMAVSLLLNGAWLIWDEKVRRPRRLESRWSKFHSGFASISRSAQGGGYARGGTAVSGGAASRRLGLLARLEQPFREAGLTWQLSRWLPLAVVIGHEFASACEQIGFGVPADEALRQMAARSQSEDLRYFTIAVLLQRETGGNLAELLDNIAALVRQRQQLRLSVRALSAEGRLSAWILGILPFALAGVISLINPDLLSLLWTDPAGRAISLGALLMMAAGILVMRQMVRVPA